MSLPTEITVYPSNALSKPIFGVRTPGDTDHVSMGDVLSGLNPLHQIPFVSQVYEAATGDTGSSAAKLIGGAILGGPIGFIVSLADVIFQQQTGQNAMTAIASAIRGDEPTTQVASAAPNNNATVLASSQDQEVLPPSQLSVANAQDQLQQARMHAASPYVDIPTMSNSDQAVLSLFGGQPTSAHQSYQKAQMLPYLKDVNVSQVI